jgi:hypothetical protein
LNLEGKQMDRLQVDVQVEDKQISAYLTDEGLVVDVFQGDENVASGYEFFNEANLLPPLEDKDSDYLAGNTLSKISEQEGWTASTQLVLLIDFIDSLGLSGHLKEYLESRI